MLLISWRHWLLNLYVDQNPFVGSNATNILILGPMMELFTRILSVTSSLGAIINFFIGNQQSYKVKVTKARISKIIKCVYGCACALWALKVQYFLELGLYMLTATYKSAECKSVKELKLAFFLFICTLWKSAIFLLFLFLNNIYQEISAI